MLLLTALIGTAAAQDTWPPDAVIEDALAVQITDEGLDSVVELIPALIPATIPIDTIAGEDGWWCANYAYELSNIWVGIEVASADLTPGNGVLDVSVDLMVQVNEASDLFNIWYEIACIDSSCPGYIEPFPVALDTTIALNVVTGDTGLPELDATIGDISVDYADIGGAIQLDCWIGDINEVLEWFGLNLYDLLLGLVGGALDGAIAGFGPELESTIEDLFTETTIEEELDVNGAIVDVLLYPNDVQITPDGIELVMAGSMSAREPALCIAGTDPGGSLRTDSGIPSMSGLPSGTHLGLLLADDFTNEAMYALYRGGLLCYELSGNDPLPINSGLLQLIAGDVFDELFPETVPMVIATQPNMPPEAYFNGDHDIDLTVQDLDLHFYAEVDGRMARVVTLGLDVDAGADLNFDPTTGALDIGVALSSENVTAEVVHNELVTGTDDVIESNFAGAFDTILETVVGGLLEGLSFNMPAFEGIGLTSLTVNPAGQQQDWLGINAGVGQTPYVAGDCNDCSGEGGGCSGGCAVGGPILNFWTMLALAVVGVRRRG
jgi:hypothetical protein